MFKGGFKGGKEIKRSNSSKLQIGPTSFGFDDKLCDQEFERTWNLIQSKIDVSALK